MIQRLIKRIFNNPPRFNVLKANAHGLSPDHLPDGAIQVVETLQDAGYDAYIVGGAVRDMLLGRLPKDFDVATNATPEQVKRLFRRAYIIGRRFRIVHVHLYSELIEVTTFRGASTGENHVNEHGRILSDNAFGSHLEDASRRDFTVNALYYDPSDNTVWDAHDGFLDIQKKRLRLIGKASVRFREDPVRILRILRFTAKLDFTMDTATKTQVKQLCHLLDMVPSARLADEFGKFLLGGYAERGLQQLAHWQLLHRFLQGISHEGGEALSPLMQFALQKADLRHAEQKSLSLPFLMAALLWPNVAEWESSFRAKGLAPALAIQDAMNEAVHLQLQKVSLTKAIIAEMRDLWVLQSQLLFPRPRQIMRALAHRKLTMGVDFLELRALAPNAALPEINLQDLDALEYPDLPAATEMVNSQACAFWAHWWRTLITAYPDAQQTLINHWDRALFLATQKAKQGGGDKNSAHKRRRPRKPRTTDNANHSAESSPSNDSTH